MGTWISRLSLDSAPLPQHNHRGKTRAWACFVVKMGLGGCTKLRNPGEGANDANAQAKQRTTQDLEALTLLVLKGKTDFVVLGLKLDASALAAVSSSVLEKAPIRTPTCRRQARNQP